MNTATVPSVFTLLLLLKPLALLGSKWKIGFHVRRTLDGATSEHPSILQRKSIFNKHKQCQQSSVHSGTEPKTTQMQLLTHYSHEATLHSVTIGSEVDFDSKIQFQTK